MWDARVTASGRGRWGLLVVVALTCGGLPAVRSGSASARAAAAPAAACSGNSSSFALIGRGSRLVSEFDVPVCVTGQLTVTFAGDPAAGCATDGLCGYSGTETFAPTAENIGSLDITTTERLGRRSTSATLYIGGPGSSVTSAVQRTFDGGTAACSDTTASLQNLAGVFFTLPVSAGRAAIDLAHASTPLLGSRCAGPLDSDVASGLPTRAVAIRALERGETTIDLGGGGQFAAHGLSGTVASTLVLTLGRAQRERQTSSVPPGARHARTFRSASVQYRIARLTGDAVVSVMSATTPAACGPFDACGLGGTLTVSPGTSAGGSTLLTAENTKLSVGALRAELRGAGPPAARLIGYGSADVHGTVQADLTQSGNTCSDSVAVRRFTVRLARRGHWLGVSLAPLESQAADPLRTRCPGPDLGSGILAATRLPATVLGRPAFTAILHGVPFTDGPYRATTDSTFALTLRRGSTHVHVIRIITVASAHSADDGRRITRAG
jgi:hypothetical protein